MLLLINMSICLPLPLTGLSILCSIKTQKEPYSPTSLHENLIETSGEWEQDQVVNTYGEAGQGGFI